MAGIRLLHPPAVALTSFCRCLTTCDRVRMVDFSHTFQCERPVLYLINLPPPLLAAMQVRVRMVDFAHTFQCERPARDANFLAGLRALLARLRGVVHAQLQQELVG